LQESEEVPVPCKAVMVVMLDMVGFKVIGGYASPQAVTFFIHVHLVGLSQLVGGRKPCQASTNDAYLHGLYIQWLVKEVEKGSGFLIYRELGNFYPSL
jgi:hypothetical protein